ncbi:peptidyl-prolyl cis-trans isomerase [Bacillus sp. JJ722]|uniref:peptidyl-prolyl cis-trans isomerase n=1 Tax=Bacillus sp. JJ722 TaxID=3122973 RepID=UPI00300018A0
MEIIVPIKGNVKYSITLDPSVWIIDDRKKKLDDFFLNHTEEHNELEEYTKAVSKHWDKEIIEGNTAPKPPGTEKKKKYIKEELTTETYGIHFHYFLNNSEPNEYAKRVIVESTNGDRTFSLDEAMKFILCFSNKGKALKEDGPIHVYYGHTKDDVITHVKAFNII